MTALLVALIVTAALFALAFMWDVLVEGELGPLSALLFAFLVLEGATYAVWAVVTGSVAS